MTKAQTTLKAGSCLLFLVEKYDKDRLNYPLFLIEKFYQATFLLVARAIQNSRCNN